MSENTNTEREALMKLADAYADASFDQGLYHRTLDDKPEEAREELEKALSKALEARSSLSPPAAGQEPIYAFRRKGLRDFCTCDADRYAELSTKPNLFEVQVFYAAPQPAVAAGWVPIETAPKDTLILLYGAKRLKFAVGMHHSRDGWVSDSTSEFLSMYPPTHWMHIPPAPSTEGEARG